MVRLREAPADLATLVGLTADSLRIDAGFVEKDFWVIEVLRAATSGAQITAKDGKKYPVQTIFKGGTSLSRAFNLIERFSEDVDLLVSFPDVDTSVSARDKSLKAIRDAVNTHLGIEGTSVSSTTGIKRNVRYAYPTQQQGSTISAGVLLEMGSRGGNHPLVECDLRSWVAEYAITELNDPPTRWEEYDPVHVDVLAPERTLLEKVALLHDGMSRHPDDKATVKLLTGGRHLYDIHKLLGSADVVSALRNLGPEGIAELCADIDSYSEAADFSFTPRPEGGFCAGPLLNADAPATDVLRQAYNAAESLIYGPRPTFEECMQTLKDNAELL